MMLYSRVLMKLGLCSSLGSRWVRLKVKWKSLNLQVLGVLPQVGSRRLPGIKDMDNLVQLWQNIHCL